VKILFIADPIESIKKYSFINDYMRDLLYHGLLETEDVQLECTKPIIPAHKQYKSQVNPDLLWGKGFTASFLIDDAPKIAKDVENKIKDKYYDLILYADSRTCLDYYRLCNDVYDSDRIFMVDGRDDNEVASIADKHLYFKRELVDDSRCEPISFAIPESKIFSDDIMKAMHIATIIPGDMSTYIFDTESSYYNDYQMSMFGLTRKKMGWDCMRHYEIIANRCVPVFADIAECPKKTLVNFPKELCLEAFDLYHNFKNNDTCHERYINIELQFINHMIKHQTTKALASYVLSFS